MVKIGIIGFGTVGSGVYEIIRGNAENIATTAGCGIDIKYILDIRDFEDHPEQNLFIKDFNIMLNDPEVSIIVETMGGLNPAYEFSKKALMAGKKMITSNKELVATHGPELLNLAKENGACYLFEASVGGGIPIIRPLTRCLEGNNILEIMGILNGTTNYILSEMIKKGKSFEDALADAQAKGYAERNPEADVEGYDACRKIAILASIALGEYVDYNNIYTEGITKITLTDVDYGDAMGMSIKLIGYYKKMGEEIVARVTPAMVGKDNPISMVDGVFNGILVHGNYVDDLLFYGRGAGKLPTASAVVTDIIEAAKSPVCNIMPLWKETGINRVMDIKDTVNKYFVRTNCKDKKKILDIFGEVVFCELKQYPDEIAFVTEEMKEIDYDKKADELGIVSMIRVLG